MGRRLRGREPSPPVEEDEVIFEIGRTPDSLPEPRRAKERPPRIEVLREEPGWTAIAKPPGISSVRERWKADAPTAISLLHDLWLERDPAAPRPRVIHRIDKETSGLLLFGRDAETARAISEAFRKRLVRKEYLALVQGGPPEPAGEVELRLQPDPRSSERMVVDDHHGKRSVTAWETVESFRAWTLLRAIPRTGRTHQIRVTFAHLGCPIVADPLYSDGTALLRSGLKQRYKRSRDREETPLLGRLALHAHRLRFEDPAGGGTIEIEAPPPKDLRLALDKLRKYAASRYGA